MSTNNSRDNSLHTITTDCYRVTIEDHDSRCLVTTWEFMGGRWVALGPGEWYDPALAWEEFGPWDNSPDNSPDNSQPAGTIYDNPLQVLQAYDTTALDNLTEEQQQYLDSFLDFESFAFTVAGDSVTIWDPIGWDVLETCSLGEFVINSLREARDATADNSGSDNSSNSPDNNSTTEEDSRMIHPYKKHDAMLDRDLSAAERLEPARAALRFAVQLLQQFENETNRAYNGLTENQLQIICNAADQAWKAAENCAFLGNSGFNGHPLEMITWEDK